MNPFVFFFVAFNASRKPLLELREPYLCYHYAWPENFADLSETLDGDPMNHPNAERILYRSAQASLHGKPLSIGSIKFLVQFDGLKFDDKRVVARVFEIVNLKIYAPLPATSSYDFDREAHLPDDFVRLIERDHPHQLHDAQRVA